MTAGSFLYGIKSNDLDFIVLRSNSRECNESLVYDLAQKSDLFHVVRNIGDAKVPIIELGLKLNENTAHSNIDGADIQIYNSFPLVDHFRRRYDTNLFYSNHDFMKNLHQFYLDETKELFALSGIFENYNIKKYVNYYKDFQVLISFVKYWAKSRCVYGKAFGYLGGISWTIMGVFFLRKSLKSRAHVLQVDNSAQRFSQLVKDFFKFFSEWSWLHPVSLIDVDFVSGEAKDYIHKTPVTILQCTFPYQNTSKNVSAEYKCLIDNEIKRAASILSSDSNDLYNLYESVCQTIELNDIKEQNHVSFKIEYNLEEDLNHLFTLIKAKSQKLVTNIQRTHTDGVCRVYPNLFRHIKQTDRNESKFDQAAYFLISLFQKEDIDSVKKKKILNLSCDFVKDIKNLSHACDFMISLETKLI